MGLIGFPLLIASTGSASECVAMVCADLGEEGVIRVSVGESFEDRSAPPAEEGPAPPTEEDDLPAEPLLNVLDQATPLDETPDAIVLLDELDLVKVESREAGEPEPETAPAEYTIATDALSVPIADPTPDLPELLLATAIAGTTAGASLWFAPGLRSPLLRFLGRFAWIGLFSRLSESAILAHPTRSDILEFVRRNPGERMEVMRQTLGLSNGTMLYHLRVLKLSNVMRVHKEGNLARLYVAGPRIQPAPYVAPLRRRILSHLQATPGPTQKQLATSLELSERMVSYHVRALHRQGLLEVQRAGCSKMLYPTLLPAAPGPSTPASR